MPSRAEWIDPPGGRSLLDLLREMYEMTQPGSKARNAYRGDLARILKDGIIREILEGNNADGKRTAKLSPKTRNRPGNGPPRAPRGRRSRMVANLTTSWVVRGDVETLTIRDGTPFSGYHQRGTRFMPARPTLSQIPPRTMREIVDRHSRLADDIRKLGR